MSASVSVVATGEEELGTRWRGVEVLQFVLVDA
jgi:hypothetical protein